MSATSRRSGGPGMDPEIVLLWVAIAIVGVGVGTTTAVVHIGTRIDGRDQDLPGNPFNLVVGLVNGTVRWPDSGFVVLGGLGGALLVVALLVAAVMAPGRRRRTRVDRAARWMGRGRDLGGLTRREAAATAKRLGVDSPGILIVRAVTNGVPLYQSWEDVSTDIAGPRTGKTTSRVVPAILSAPGAVLATSNKRDMVDATRDIRAAKPGAQVWVFDPQGIVDEPPSWWWNPLTYVTDEVKAQMLADVFASAARDPSSRADAFFEPAGRLLLGGLLLAAAVDRRRPRYIDQVYTWLSDPSDDEPVVILREYGYTRSAEAVASAVYAPDKQRAGVFGTAQQMASFLINRQAMQWVTPGDALHRPHFDPHEFVTSAGSLYSLSKEGQGSAGPLVTALTVAVTEAAEDLAKRSPGGRLPVPMVAVLDEAANVCRWRELPNIYSHYGSRGICMMTFLQSWSQGVEVWGREGMRKLWSASNVKVYAGGVSEVEFLGELSQLIGDFDLNTRSVSHGGRSGSSSQRSTRREKILDVADLGALPKGRAIVIASGTRPTLGRTVPWMSGPYAEQVKASIRAHDPTSSATLTEAAQSLREVQQQETTGLAGLT